MTDRKLRVLGLFSGIGGFELGLQRAGFEIAAMCEIDPYCRRVLAKHWPEVPIYEDVRELTGDRLAADGISVDVICGGFPCQDISVAGKGAGLAGERSGLWREYARIIGEIRPRFVIVENVAALLGRGLAAVLGDLSTLGYDAEWHCIPAASVGAPHRRDRLWIVANAVCKRGWIEPVSERQRGGATDAANDGAQGDVAHSAGERRRQRRTRRPDSESKGLCDATSPLADAHCKPVFGAAITWPERSAWDFEPEMGRVVDGVPHRLVEEELRALGNAVVPQIPELIGKAILETLNPSLPDSERH